MFLPPCSGSSVSGTLVPIQLSSRGFAELSPDPEPPGMAPVALRPQNNLCFSRRQSAPGLRSADAAAAPDAQRVGEHAAGTGPAHHHQVPPAAGPRLSAQRTGPAFIALFPLMQKRRNQPRRVHLLLEEINATSDRARFNLPAVAGERLFTPKNSSRLYLAALCLHTLRFCPFRQTCVVQTPQGHEYEGRRYDGKGVSDG